MPDSRPDDDALRAGFTRWLADRHGRHDMAVTSVERPSSGYSSQTVMLEVGLPEDEGEGGEWFVLRMAPANPGTFRDYDLVSQTQAQLAAATAGVPVADPVVETDPRWIGAPFMAMPRISGHIIGAAVHADPWLGGLGESERACVYRALLETVARVHRADVSKAAAVPRRDNEAQLAFWDDYMRWSSDGNPVAALVDALQWCRRHRPEAEPPGVLLWGDVRFENTVFGDDLTLRALLDWDMTSVGPPEHDLAWFTSLETTMDRLFGNHLAGTPDRSGIVDIFEEASGRPVRDLEWYETLAMVRSTAIMTRIGYLRKQAGKRLLMPLEDNPLLDLLAERLR